MSIWSKATKETSIHTGTSTLDRLLYPYFHCPDRIFFEGVLSDKGRREEGRGLDENGEPTTVGP